MDCKNSSLCIFDTPGVLTDIQNRYLVDYYPSASLDSSSPIEFEIRGSTEDYIDLSSTFLYVKFKVTDKDKKDVDQTADFVGLNNLAIASLFSDATLKIGETQIEGGSSDYPYRAYFRNVMQFTPSAQRTEMKVMGWYKDEAGKFNDKTNTGFVARQKLVGDSQSVELMGPLYFDFFNQDRHLISSTNMTITLTPHKPEFVLNAYPAAAKDFKIVFEKVVLYVERLQMNPSVINGHALGLQTQNARYFVNHTDLLSFTIPSGTKSYTKEHLFPHLAPKFLMMAMVDNEALNGNYKKNPFHFQHFNLNSLALFREGKTIARQALTPDFDTKSYLRSYVQTMRAFNYWDTDDTNGLTPEEWANGYTIWAYDLTPDKEASSSCLHAHVGKDLRLEISFKKALTSTINILVYAITDSQIELTRLRDVITHYNR